MNTLHYWIGLALCSLVAQAEVWRMAIGDYPPYTSPHHRESKLAEQIVTEALKLQGVRVEYNYFPWKRSYAYVQTGQFDATFPWNRTAEREQEFIYNSVPLIRDEGVVFHLKAKPIEWKELTDLRPYRMGVTLGYKQEQAFKELGFTTDVSPTAEINFKKMLNGRIDIFQTSKVVGYALMREHLSLEERKLITHHRKVVEENVFYMLFTRKNPESITRAAKLDAGLKRLIASGRYGKILAEYLGDNP